MAIACSTSLGQKLPLPEALARISRLGFRHVDLLSIDGWVHVNTRDLAERWEETVCAVDRTLSEAALVPIATNSGVSPQFHHRTPEVNAARLREVEALVRWMNHLGIGVAAIQPRQGDAARPWEDVLADCVATLEEQFAVGREGGVRFGVELHVNSPFETPEQARRLLEAMPQVTFVYDPTHAVCQGLDVRETEWVMDHAVHVHLRDAAPGHLQTAYGEGAVDFAWVLTRLRDRGYTGHFSIEYFDAPEFDVDASVLRLRDEIARYFEP
jgi:sugar phosphate isomerase/epimerase